MKKYVLLLMLVMCFSCYGFCQPGRIDAIRRVNDILWQQVIPGFNPTAIKKTLDSIASLHDKEITEYAWYFNWYHQAYLDTNIDKRLGNLRDINKKIGNFNTPGLKALHKFRLGDFLFNQKQYTDGMGMMLEAKSEMADIGYEKIPYAGQLLYILSVHYYGFNNYRRSIDYADLAHRYQSGTQTTGADNTWGLAYQKLGQYDSAAIKFKQVIELARSQQSTVWISIASGNLGRTYCLQERYSEGIPLLYKDVVLNREVESTNSAVSALYIAEAFIRLHKTDSAVWYISLAKDIFSKFEPWKGEVFYRSKFGYYYYTQLSGLFKERRKFSEALKMTDTANNYLEKYKSQFDWTLLSSSEKRIQDMEYLQSIALLDSQKRAERLQKMLLIGILLGLVIIAALIISRQTVKYRKEKELAKAKENVLELKRQQAEQDLVSTRIKLDEFLNKVVEKNELIEKIKNSLTSIAPDGPAADGENSGYKKILLESTILTEEDWQSFKTLYERIWPGFFAKHTETYPDLTPAETRLLALTKLELSSKDMANMLAISQESLRKSRYRLRKKYPGLLPRED